ncbi:hypothetical protein NZK35_31725 [Stieleria sp. ICT_E10.1]|uniref:hypothetical protein n=1 Tax=Stieleria sedimenti TaxID=2976331 RepID=UPI0021803EB0|nr:hypothetical protein [Stieleria sedimenti]MCS7471247.1 hypothetical protein [Stieleria sedimenti]
MQIHKRRSFWTRNVDRLSVAITTLLVVANTTGCLPEAPPLDGMLSFREANELLFEEHANHGAIYNIDHTWNGKPFKAEWRLANYLKKSAQLQIKPPTETFDEVDLCMALETALADESSNPWHNVADDAILRGFRHALQNDDTHIAAAYCPDAPYDIMVKVKNNGSEWFCEVKVQNLIDPKKLEEAQKYAQEQLDRLEKQHAHD